MSVIILLAVLAMAAGALILGYRRSARVHGAWWTAMQIVSVAGMNLSKAMKMAYSGSRGAGKVEIIIMVFVAMIILYQLINNVSEQNALVQASANASTMAKFSAALGEWMFPLFGILGLVFLLWKGRGKASAT